MIDFHKKLDELVSTNRISEETYKHFVSRGMKYEKFNSEFPFLKSYFPHGVPIGASEKFIDKLNFPYQETSYVCASVTPSPPNTYLFKTKGKGGGVINLLGGKRPLGDCVFGSLNRIFLGSHAILISADNLMANPAHIWKWNFFGNHLKHLHHETFLELQKLAKKFNSNPIHVIIARKKNTLERLAFLENYLKNKIAIFNSNDIKIIMITNKDGYNYLQNKIPTSDKISYISETDDFGDLDIKKCFKTLRKKYQIKKILNDGGRKMSLGLKKLNLLGGERISYEPFPGEYYIPDEISHDMILGRDGFGIDGSQIPDTVVAFSQKLSDNKQELFNLHLYAL